MMGYGGWGNMMGDWGSASWLIGIFGWVTMLVFWLLLILGVVALLRYLGASGGHTRDNKKEYEERKKDLS